MSSLRGRKRGGKSPNTNETGPSGSRERRAAEEPTELRPLVGKVIYLDVAKTPLKLIDRLKADLRELGAVEPFLSKNITGLFSDRPEAAEIAKSQASRSSQTHPSGASPAVSTPSPFQQWKDSPADSPADPSSSNAGHVMTRGRVIADKADTSSKTRGSTDVLNNACNMDIPVRTLDRILNYCEREKEKRKKMAKEKGESSAQKSKKKERQLQRHYLKVEDLSRRYRPISKEMDVWPRMVVDSGDNCSPFVGRVPPAQAQRDDAVTNTPAKTPQKPAESAQERKSAQKSTKKSAKKPRIPVSKKKTAAAAAGYCECCRGRYSDMEEHVESSSHQYFVKNRSNYSSLDAMINEGPNIEKFLRDCLQYQESTSSSSERSPGVLDEIVFISEMDQAVDPQPPEEDGASPSTPRKGSQDINQQTKGTKSPKVSKSPPKTSTPRKKKRVTGSKRRRSSISLDKAVGGPSPRGVTGNRLSPRLRSKEREVTNRNRTDTGDQPLDDGGEIIEVVSSPPKPNPRGDGKSGMVSGDQDDIDERLGEQNIPGSIGYSHESPPKMRPITTMTPLSPRSRLSLTRRRRRQMLDMSPATPPCKKKKLRDGPQGRELGVIDCELLPVADAGTTPRRRKNLTDGSPGRQNNVQRLEESSCANRPSKMRPHEKQSADSAPSEDSGSVKKKKRRSQQTCPDGSLNVQTDEPTTQANKNCNNSQDVGLSQGNKNFPQGTKNTSRVRPFLGHAHTDFGLNPSRQSEITGSEDEHLRTIFRSDPLSNGDFEGFSNEEIQETELLHDSLTKSTNNDTLQERLKSAALDVVYVPTSELGAAQQDDGSESDSVSSDGSLEVDIVFQKVENFPSDGSEWETQVQGFMTKLDEALEDREEQAKKIQENLKRKEEEMERKKAELERKEAELERKKAEAEKRNSDAEKKKLEAEEHRENAQAAAEAVVARDQEVLDVDQEVCKSKLVERIKDNGETRQKKASLKAEEDEVFKVQERELKGGRKLRPRKSTASPDSSKAKNQKGDSERPPRKSALQDISSPGNLPHGSPAGFSTPKSRRNSLGKLSIPHVTFSPKVSVEEQDVIIENYVYDGEEDEVSFPKLSSPAQEGWKSSPVKKFAPRSGGARPSTPTKSSQAPRLRRRSSSAADSTRPLLFLRLKVPPSRKHSTPTCPMSPPTSPFKKNAAPLPLSPFKKNAPSPLSPFKSPRKGAPPSKKSPPIFALLYDERSRRRGLTPILVTNRRPNFSREILQPSLRLSMSKRRARKASRTLAALNLSLPHIFDVFEFHDEVETAECGTQTPQRRTRARAASFPMSRGPRRLRRSNSARRKLCVATESSGTFSADLPSTSGHVYQKSVSSTGKNKEREDGVIGTFEGSNLARPFDLPLSFYM